MASNHTENFGLCQWEATDQVLRTEFNEDNQKIDAALKNQSVSLSNLSDQLENKANTATVNNLSSTVSQKADRSELEAEKAAREAADIRLNERAGMQLIKRVTLNENTYEVKIDLTEVDWTQWATVRVVMKPILSEDGRYNVNLNGTSYMSMGQDLYLHFHLTIFSTFDPDIGITGLQFPEHENSNAVIFGVPLKNCSNILFRSTTPAFQSGTLWEIWGEK